MTDVGKFAKGESHPKDPENNEEGNIRCNEIWVNLSESRNDNPFELQQMVKYLKEELKQVKQDNEQVLKAHEELNNVMLSKLHSNEEEKNKGPKLNLTTTAPYKRKVRNLEFSNHEIEYSSEESAKHSNEKYKDSSESSDNNQQQKNTNRMKRLPVN